MTKIVYVVREYCLKQSGDDFDLYYTFDLEDARKNLSKEANRGYRINRKKPTDVAYIIFGYEVDTNEIDEDEEYDVNNAKSLLWAFSNSQAYLDHIYDEQYEEADND